MERTALQEVAEMFDRQIYGQQLTVKGAIPAFAVSEASVMRQVGAFGLGWLRSVASARASLVLLKAERYSSVHSRGAALSLGCVSSWSRGWSVAAHEGRKRL